MAVAYKEWYLVCRALGEGRQHVLLRKGGIAEGRDGFAFKNESFYLFSSFFHEQGARLRIAGEPGRISGEEAGSEASATPLRDPLAKEGMVVVRWFVRIEETKTMNSWEETVALEPLHIWKRDLIRERFEYKEDSRLHCALVRIFELPEPWSFPDHRSFGGCRSWLTLPDPPDSHASALAPVISDEYFANVKQSVGEIFQQRKI